MNLYDVLENSYTNNPNALEKHDYLYDKDLSDDDQQVYYNKKENKLLYSITGSHKTADIGTDIYMGLGKLKDTNRYKTAEYKASKMREKYNNAPVTIVGSSLGGTIASRISKPEDKVINYNRFSHFNEKVRDNETNYRKSGDLISIFNNKKNTQTINNTHGLLDYIPRFGFKSSYIPYKDHQLKHLDKENIFI